MTQAIGSAPLADRAELSALVVFLLTGEPLERIGVKPGEPLALARQPLVIAALQQFPAYSWIASPSCPAATVRSNCSTSSHSGASGVPLERPRADLDQSVSVRQHVTQRVQDLAQVRVRLAFGRVRPEHERQVLARLRHVVMEQQVSEQRFGSRGIQWRELLAPETQIHGPEQPRARRTGGRISGCAPV